MPEDMFVTQMSLLQMNATRSGLQGQSFGSIRLPVQDVVGTSFAATGILCVFKNIRFFYQEHWNRNIHITCLDPFSQFRFQLFLFKINAVSK